MKVIALDIGLRRTGVAFTDTDIGIAFPQKTIKHTSLKELFKAVDEFVKERQVEHIVLGLPLLLSGKSGSQVELVYQVYDILQKKYSVSFLDERYTSEVVIASDKDAKAACELLNVYLKRKK